MTEGETTRLIAWHREMRAVHDRLRHALEVTRYAVADGVEVDATSRDLLLWCHGFCVALDGHHRGEDATLFPALVAAHPDLAPAIRQLEQDHAMIGHLLAGLRAALDRTAPRAELEGHLEGVAAIMESHFRYEERELLGVLAGLDLDATKKDAYGPL